MPSLDRLKEALADRYAIESEIGRGGMAVVYLADDLRHKRKVALKALMPELAATLGSERFLREIETAAKLSHPHILPLYDSGEAEGFLYYVMPYVEEGSLRDRLDREGPLPVDDALRIAREVAGGLGFAHSQDVIHRDIKPGNILLSRGHAVVADFGVARAIDEAGVDKVTRTGVSVGSPVYMSPEQATGDERLDNRTDIYALGCVVYEMLAGEPPFTGATPAAIMARKLTASAPPLSSLREQIPAAVEGAVERALAKIPADRFATAEQFAAAWTSDAGAEPARAGSAWRGRVAGAAIGVMILVALAFAADSWLNRGPAGSADATTIESIAVLPFADMSPTQDQAYFGAGIAEVLLNALARVPDLRVPGRSSSFQFDEPSPDIREVGSTLGVEAVLEGSVRLEEDTVRINAQLVNVSDGLQLWSESYTRAVGRIFATQEEIAREIVAALGVQLAGAETTALVDAQETLPEVFDLQLRGQYLLSRGLDREAKETAIEIFLQAIALDSTYAPAYAGLSRAYGGLTLEVPGDEVEGVRRLWRTAAERALALDDGLSDAHAAYAAVLKSEGRFDEAERAFLRALELSPGNAAVQSQYADLLIIMRREEESIREARYAVALDPLSLESRRVLVAALAWAGRHAEVLNEGGKTLELDPDNEDALYWTASAYRSLGRYEEAIGTAQRLVDLDPRDHYNVGLLAYAHASAGDREATLRALAVAEEIGMPLKEFAIVYGLLGELDTAYAYLERALVEEPGTLFWMNTDPSAEALRVDPRWGEFLKKIEAAR